MGFAHRLPVGAIFYLTKNSPPNGERRKVHRPGSGLVLDGRPVVAPRITHRHLTWNAYTRDLNDVGRGYAVPREVVRRSVVGAAPLPGRQALL
jgi:hypothetical protein